MPFNFVVVYFNNILQLPKKNIFLKILYFKLSQNINNCFITLFIARKYIYIFFKIKTINISRDQKIPVSQDILINLESFGNHSGSVWTNWDSLWQNDRIQNPSSARMAGAGTAYKLLGSFLKLQKACPKAFLSYVSDSDGDIQVTLKVLVPRHDNQAPRRVGCQPRRQEGEPGTQAPSPALGSVNCQLPNFEMAIVCIALLGEDQDGIFYPGPSLPSSWVEFHSKI